MNAQLTTARVERLFMGAMDQTLAASERAELDGALAADETLRRRFEAYRLTIEALRKSPRETAPAALSSVILRRTRRRRLSSRRLEQVAHGRFPAEVVIPLLLAALVALLMVLGGP